MGQKVNPIGLRLGINRTWDSRWYDDRNYAKLLAEDLKIRAFIEKRLAQAGISRDRHRAAGEAGPDHDPHRPSGRGDRQEGPGDRGRSARSWPR